MDSVGVGGECRGDRCGGLPGTQQFPVFRDDKAKCDWAGEGQLRLCCRGDGGRGEREAGVGYRDGESIYPGAAPGRGHDSDDVRFVQGWPTKGPNSGSAVASAANAKTYWNQVGCAELFGKRNTWWYTLFDANLNQQDIEFAVVNRNKADGQKFNLACPA